MLRLDLTRKPVDAAALKLRNAREDDYERLVRGPFALYEDGVLRVVYLPLDERLTELRKAVVHGPYGMRGRTGGLKTRSATFGFAPRHPLFHDFCNETQWSSLHAQSHRMVCSHAGLVARHYQARNPALYADHLNAVFAQVRPAWRIGVTPFTSGIANENTPLAYHYDSGNFPGVWSGMIVLKDGTTGGHLSLPEYGIGVDCADRSLLLFDGQGVLHGVTPIRKTRADGYRYSVVYYSMQAMWQCLTPGEELARARGRRDAMETKRATTGDNTALIARAARRKGGGT